MPFTVKCTFNGPTHSDDEWNQMKEKLSSLPNYLGISSEENGQPVHNFQDQDSANQYAEFLKQFNPENVEVQETPAQ